MWSVLSSPMDRLSSSVTAADVWGPGIKRSQSSKVAPLESTPRQRLTRDSAASRGERGIAAPFLALKRMDARTEDKQQSSDKLVVPNNTCC